jgi:hypothetical protein
VDWDICLQSILLSLADQMLQCCDGKSGGTDAESQLFRDISKLNKRCRQTFGMEKTDFTHDQISMLIRSEM